MTLEEITIKGTDSLITDLDGVNIYPIGNPKIISTTGSLGDMRYEFEKNKPDQADYYILSEIMISPKKHNETQEDRQVAVQYYSKTFVAGSKEFMTEVEGKKVYPFGKPRLVGTSGLEDELKFDLVLNRPSLAFYTVVGERKLIPKKHDPTTPNFLVPVQYYTKFNSNAKL